MIKVLVVDDELDVCNSLERILTREGYQVIIATSGMQALDKVQSERPQLILLDLRMPHMDGLETLERIRQIDKEAVITIVTAVHDAEVAEKTIKLGAINYITKPFDADMLKRSLRNWATKIESDELSRSDIIAFKYNNAEEFKVALDIFIKKGYHIKSIDNKDSELDITQGLPDILILRADIMGVDTIAVLSKYKAAHPQLPIMIVTGPESSAELMKRIEECGPCHCLPAYFDTSGLMLVIYKIVCGTKARGKTKEANNLSDYIFIVDDEPDICEYTARFLTKAGYKVRTITNSLEVFDEVKALKPSMVFLDIVMPGVDGLELLKKIKKFNPQIQVVMMTGITDEAVCRESIECGACDYIIKPFSLEQIKAAILVNEAKVH